MDLEPCKYSKSFDCCYKQLKKLEKENEELKMRCNFLMETLKAQGERKIDR